MRTYRALLLGVCSLAALRPSGAKTARSDPVRESRIRDTSVVEVTGSKCPTLAEDGTFRCFAHPYGLVFARDTAGLAAVLEAVHRAGETFTRAFGKAPGRGALVLTSAKDDATAKRMRPGLSAQATLAVSPRTAKTLFGLGYHWVTAFPPQDSFVTMVSKQLAAQLPDPTMLADMRESLLPLYDGLLSHELGHAWFISRYWPALYPRLTLHPETSKEYASPAPDWLDECAAIALENAAMIAQRRDLVRSTYQNNPDDPRLLSPDTLFTMAHPFSGKGNEGKVDMFYAANRVLIDFLLPHSTPDHPIFDAITKGVLKGQTMAAWLRASGLHYGLPTTVAELNTQWRQWIATH